MRNANPQVFDVSGQSVSFPRLLHESESGQAGQVWQSKVFTNRSTEDEPLRFAIFGKQGNPGLNRVARIAQRQQVSIEPDGT